MRMEVRCCCQPQKILGWIEGNVDHRRGWVQLVKLRPYIDPWNVVALEKARIEILTLPISRIRERGDIFWAVKAEGYTLDQLKEYRGFIPNEAPCNRRQRSGSKRGRSITASALEAIAWWMRNKI